MVPSEAIGERGRDVRCKKCSHVWFQKSERDSLNELINRIQSTDTDEDDISFGDSSATSVVTDKDEKTPLIARMRAVVSGVMSRFKRKPVSKPYSSQRLASPKNTTVSNESSVALKYVAGGMVGLALFSVLFYGVVSMRWSLVHAVPAFAGVFEGAGFPVSPYASVNPEDALILEKVEMASGQHGVTITGNLINLTSDTVRIPALKVTYLDGAGGILREDRYALAQAGLSKEANIAFTLPVSAEVSGVATSVEVRFSE